MMCDPVREITSFPLLSHRLLSSFCPWVTYWTIPPFDEAYSSPTLLSVACTLLVPVNIPATTRRYRKVRHTQITLRHAIIRQLCYPSKISPPIVVKLAFSLRRHFFQRGLRHLISRERRITRIIWKTARANYPKNAGDYPPLRVTRQ